MNYGGTCGDCGASYAERPPRCGRCSGANWLDDQGNKLDLPIPLPRKRYTGPDRRGKGG